MKTLKIYLSPFAYYVRIDLDYLEEFKKKNAFQKWGDGRKEMQLYEFIEFTELGIGINTNFPMKVNRLGVLKCRYHCYNPFGHGFNVSTSPVEPEKVLIKSERSFQLFFKKEQTSKISDWQSSYHTAPGKPWIQEVRFGLDEALCDLSEEITYSDGSRKSNSFRLIAKSTPLNVPERYALFDFQ